MLIKSLQNNPYTALGYVGSVFLRNTQVSCVPILEGLVTGRLNESSLDSVPSGGGLGCWFEITTAGNFDLQFSK